MEKKLVLVLAVIIIAVVGGFALRARSGSDKKEEEIMPTPQAVLPTINPSVKVDLAPRADGRAVILTVNNIPADVTTIDYELTYNTGEGLPRGVLGQIKLKGEREIEREILLGTCSKNTCSYDEGVEEVSLVLKFNSPQGASQFKSKYSL